MGFQDLLQILRESRQEAEAERSRRPSACPNDGTPLKTGPNGELYCEFDGWRWNN